MFIDELCHDLVESHRRALGPMSSITNQTSLFTYQSEWKEQLEATDVLCVQEVQAVQKTESGGQRPAKAR